jgi:Uma2 family endonuclease
LATLVVEVSDTTLRHDLVRKARRYAHAAIGEYWVVDIEREIIHQLWQPAGESYDERREVPLGGTIASATIENLQVETPGA